VPTFPVLTDSRTRHTLRAFHRLIAPALLGLTLTGCSMIQPEPEGSPAQEPETAASTGSSTLIVESLINEAGELGRRDVSGPAKPPLTEDEAFNQGPQPAVPTINMTANRVVEQAINDLLQNRQALLRIWVERSHTYFPMIEQIFAEEEVPDELKYLALGESGLRPTVRSSAGAVGMWQFMYGTARSSGLEINAWVDERRDPELATRAAARHFKELYKSYSGNWELALAGYNCSYRCITRAARRVGKPIEEKPTYWEIYPFLPRETRAFVPKFVASALIISNPEMYGVQVDSLGQEIAYDIVEVRGMLALETAADLAGTDLATIRNLNPALIKATLPDQLEPYALKIPLGSFNRFVRNFDNMPADAKVAPSEYTIKRGDTLAAIARSADTTVDELKAVNGIRGHLIYPGQKLLLPGTGLSADFTIGNRERRFVAYGETERRPIELREEFQLVELNGSTEDKPLMGVTLNAELADDMDMLVPTIHRVSRGDTLGQIAERYDVSVKDIQQWNNIRGTTIYVNQELSIHSVPAKAVTTYRVQRGDSLSIIARRFGVSVDNIKRWNNLRSNLIFPGQDLSIN